MFYHRIASIVVLLPLRALCQQRGTVSAEVHPTLSVSNCVASKCTASTKKVVLDANWRWLHNVGGTTNCYAGGSWNTSFCPSPATCAQACALEGADYANTYGVTTSGGNLTLQLFPSGGSIGSRVYLLSDDDHYQVFSLKNQEFSFQVDVSGLPCGTNGAVYFTNMLTDGGTSAYPNNAAGARYGTGYCDAQCPQDIKFINGEANLLNWNSATSTGRYGSCCHEMDIWEANSISTAYTAHPCTALGQQRCDSTTSACANACDSAGCDFNPYRLQNTTYYGPSGTVKTAAPNTVRVVTQFITSNNTAAGTLTEIRRLYVQNGVVIANAKSNVASVTTNSLSDSFCAAQKSAFGETNTFSAKGGMGAMQNALQLGMVLTMSVWLDYGQRMLWLDSVYPQGANASQVGTTRGPCATTSGYASDLQSQYPNAQVKFFNIRYGDIGSTYP